MENAAPARRVRGRFVYNKYRTWCIDRDSRDQRAHASVSCVHTDRNEIRVHHPGLLQDLGSGITLRDGRANSWPSEHAVAERE